MTEILFYLPLMCYVSVVEVLHMDKNMRLIQRLELQPGGH